MLRNLLGTTARICFDTPNEGGGGSSGSEGGTSQQETQTPVWVKELQDAMGAQTAGIRELVNAVKGMNQPATSEEEEEEEEEQEGPSGDDLEKMPRAQFLQLAVEKIIKAVNKQALVPMQKQIATLTTTTKQKDLVADIKAFAQKPENKDFWEWEQEMGVLAAKHPTLGAKHLYRMAREEDPDKASKMDKKYKLGKEGAEDSGEGGKKGIAFTFSGFTPNGSTGAGKHPKAGRMARDEASNDAWEKAVKEAGGEPMFDG